MNKFKYIALSVIAFITITMIQVNIVNQINIFGVIPNLFIIFIAYINILSDDNILVNILSIVFGLLFDICFGNILGVYALISLVVSLITPIICRGFSVETKIGMMLYIFIISFVWEVLFGIIYLIINGATFVMIQFVLIVFITSIINVFAIMIFHGVFSNYLKEKNEEYKIIRKY